MGLRALLDANTQTITVVGKSSAFQAKTVLETTPEDNCVMVADSVQFLVQAGRDIIFDAEHFFDGWKEDPKYTLSVIQAAAEAGAYRVVLCDTNGGTLPDEVYTIT